MLLNKEHIICGLDVGTTKVSAVIADTQINPEHPEIIGIGVEKSTGLKRGMIINADDTIRSIRSAIEKAERMGGVKISKCYVGIAGDHIRSLNTSGVISINNHNHSAIIHEIDEDDINRVLDHARDVNLPEGWQIIHALPQEFIVDAQDGIKKPLGLCGARLEAKVHMVTGANTAVANLVKCVKGANLTVAGIVLEQLASAYSVLDRDEMNLGTVLLDIGGGTTDIIIFYEGGVWHTGVIPLGGFIVSNDISAMLKTPFESAEAIKIKYGCCKTELIDRDVVFSINGIGGRGKRDIKQEVLAAYIEARMQELFDMVIHEVKRVGIYPQLAGGVVVTGGGSLLEGVVSMAEERFQMPTRRGLPSGFSGLKDVVNNPQYATGLGLIKYGMKGNGSLISSNGTGQKRLGHYISNLKKLINEIF